MQVLWPGQAVQQLWQAPDAQTQERERGSHHTEVAQGQQGAQARAHADAQPEQL